ncbi:MAG: methyltransferase domain-containing protein [Actinomycetota bacterium]|nr:methyltransferase domain-containing protein [Actinomycetota bacterium]
MWPPAVRAAPATRLLPMRERIPTSPSRLAARISLVNRRRKMRLFMDVMQPRPETSLVDVGVADTGFMTEDGLAATQNFFEEMYPWPARITAVSDVPLSNFQHLFPKIRTVVADGRHLPFPDASFDIAFSNAVVEHLEDLASQRRFVHELCRVARHVFVTTPNRWFPIETHTLVPFVHWLPRQARNKTFAALRRHNWDDIELLGPSDLLSLFPPESRPRIVQRGITLAAVAEPEGDA